MTLPPAVAPADLPAARRLAVALDVDTLDEAEAWVRRLAPPCVLFKVGLRLFAAYGPEAVRRLRGAGAEVFLDVKLHDIPSTVAAAARAIAAVRPAMLTVHASGGAAMVRAAVDAAPETAVLAVTLLTSLDAAAQAALFGPGDPVERAVRWARAAAASGAAGVVCSPREASAVRRALAETGRSDALVVTPGIRPAGAPADDQARTATAGEAIRAGATHIVVGRPILGAVDPAAAARAFITEIEAAARP